MAFKADISPDRLGYRVGAVLMALQEGTTDVPQNVRSEEGKLQTVNYLWNTVTMDYEIETVSTGSGGGSTHVDANLTSVGSTRLVGRVTVDNPTTSVNVANPTTAVNVANPTTAVNVANQPTVDLSSVGSTRSVGTVNQGSPAGTSADAWWVRTVTTGSAGSGSTHVDADLTSAGSTKVVGTVNVTSGTVLGPSTAAIGLISSGTQTIGAVELSSAGSTRSVGTVNQGSPAGTSADAWWVRTVTTGSAGGSTTVDANVTSAGSTKIFGINNYESFTSDITSRTSIVSSADGSLFPTSTNVRARIVQNNTTLELGLNLSTVAVASGSSGHQIRIAAGGYACFGGQTGNFPLYVGPIRTKSISTANTGAVIGTQFLLSTT